MTSTGYRDEMVDRILEPGKLTCWEIETKHEPHGVGCAECQQTGERNASYHKGEAVLVGPLDSPFGDGQAHYFCNAHLDQYFGHMKIERIDPVTLRMP